MLRILHTRRQILQSVGWAGSACVQGCQQGSLRSLADVAAPPDPVLHSAGTITVDKHQPCSEPLAVEGSRFVAVDRNEARRPIAGANSTMIGAERMTVTPGLIDAHSRPSGAGGDELLLVTVDLRSVRAIQPALQARVEATAPGEWAIGLKYDDTELDEGRPINRLDLDEVAPDHPVELCKRGGHTAVYNSKAFQLVGITAQTPDPRGGSFYRESGELTGLVADLGDRGCANVPGRRAGSLQDLNQGR